ncbi:F0F1 ATP synthase subunit alpha [Maridesulfovibrio hydrothermalis]|uniref:ATP synthase subunit alpha n=1 Tax=Maridesulfovibrio hydrothermalis AM13 = DSM 14728 TaxID=1121451 RepID=L0REY8_9BACT|nr:F0F1 ATP synthase subunit alpha [Maridesulfovibrio hydrothermalis]CCO24765.1 ATP synthase (subunit alpha, component F1) [Maridesulfovibrio hydrothermalis AM13 = DSM 14728]
MGFIADNINQALGACERGLDKMIYSPESKEVGRVLSVARGVAQVEGLKSVRSEELVMLGNQVPGMALDLLPDSVGVALLGSNKELRAGDEAAASGAVLSVPVGDALIGRVIDPLGNPLDEGPAPETFKTRPVETEAPSILMRAPVDTPMASGIKVIDTLIPIGRGQRELILGDRQTGKTAIALDIILNQNKGDVVCVYCAIGQRSTSVARVIETLRLHGAMAYTFVVVVEGNAPSGMQYIAPYAATSMAEYFMEQGRDVLIIYDDLTRHAQAYRQLSLLMRRPPGREAFPGDIFYIHSRLLERSTRLKPEHGGGTLTALPVVETEAQNISAYIPTNLISITDGQIYLSPVLFQKGMLPAIDVGKSVSRVGGRAQPTAYRKVSGDLRLTYSQFQELEAFARFGTRLDKDTRKRIEHGVRVRELLKQDRFSPLTASEQLIILWTVSLGLLDDIPLDRIAEIQDYLLAKAGDGFADIERLPMAEPKDAIWDELERYIINSVNRWRKSNAAA